jgi:hypothetical protein
MILERDCSIIIMLADIFEGAKKVISLMIIQLYFRLTFEISVELFCFSFQVQKEEM